MTSDIYSLKRKNKYAHKRFKRIFLGTCMVIETIYGIIFVTQTIKGNRIMNEFENTQDFDEIKYLDVDSKEGRRILNVFNDWKEHEDEYLNRAISYFNSEEYLNDLANDNVYFTGTTRNSEGNEATFEERTIKLYCDIYQVNYEKVYDRLAELTNNFTSNEYMKGVIPFVTFKKELAHFDNPEALLLAAVRCCKQAPEQMGLSDIDTHMLYETDLTEIEQLSYFADVLGADKALVYAIGRSETGLFNSELSNLTNNVGNLKDNGKWMRFDNRTQSIIELCTEVVKFYREGRYSIEEIAEAYAPLDDDNEHWIGNVTEIYEQAMANYDELFSSKRYLAGR